MNPRRRAVSLVGVISVVCSTFVFAIAPPPAQAAVDPAPNPDLEKACGLDVLMILDESGSIQSSHATQDVRNAFSAFVDSLNNTGSKLAVEEFSTVARLPQIGGNAPGSYVTIDDTTLPAFDDYINNDYNPADRTNWEDAMRLGYWGAPRPDPDTPHLVVFITDGDPTQVIDRRDVPNSVYYSNTQISNGDTSSASGNAGLNPAIPNANSVKGQGSHILAIGVGAALNNNSSVQRLVAMSGPDIFDGTGTFDIATDDVYLEPNFANLEEALRETAFQLCAPSVSIRKLVDLTPDPNSSDDAVAGTGYEMEGTVTAPPPADFTWVLPHTAVDGNPVATAITDGSGFATFQWTPTDVTATSSFEVREATDVPGYELSTAACSYRTPDQPDTDFPFDVITENGEPVGLALEDIPTQAIVTCQVVNIADPAPAISIEKYTNGVDADTEPGPFIIESDPVNWTYLVTNEGNTTLNTVAVVDNQGVAVSCPETTLAQGENITCTASGTATAGQYENLGTVTAVDTWGTNVTDDDPSHYFGSAPGVAIEKSTVAYGVAYDADTYIDANGDVIAPLIAVDDPVSWTYEVTNSGNEAIENIVVSDDQEGAVTCNDTTLAVGASTDCMLVAGASTAVEGAYANLATVTADPVPGGDEVSDNDPSHYLGYALDVDIEKATNGQDADDPNGPDVPVLTTGDPVTWTYAVTNTGNYPLTDLDVTDSEGVVVTCPADPDPLLPGASIVCQATGTAEETGELTDPPYANVGTVVADPYLPPILNLPAGHPLLSATATADDPSHYRALTPGIDIEKATNTEDADDPTGPFIPVGDQVDWTYVVTNTGTSTISNILALDYRASGGVSALSCPSDTLDPGVAMNCTLASGISVEGQFVNSSGVIGVDELGNIVSDADPSHYFGSDPNIQIEKYTNGVDADDPMGAFIEVGDPVEWTYVVTNTGNDALSGIVVTDDQEGSVTCDATSLAIGASTNCTLDAGPSTAVAGQYANEATVTATDSGQQQVTDSDPSHYFGYIVEVDIEKATNGEDADTPTGPQVAIGSAVTWTYVVTNPGDVPLLDVVVTDDQGVVPVFQGGDTNGDDKLDPAETWIYEAAGTAALGQYQNNGTVVAQSDYELDIGVTDTDPSHYIGVEAAIQIVKSPDTAEVPRGNPHTFQIEVTNIGTEELTDVVVTDPITPSCDMLIGDLAVGEVVTYDCVVDVVMLPIDNTAFVDGTDQFGTVVTDEDDAQVFPVDVGGTAAIGDTVWHDDNGNGVQDPGEDGIAGARVRVVTTSPVAGAVDEILLTDANGRYLAAGLVAGTYEVSLDLSSVTGTLTTPGVFIVVLDAGDQYLDADFGVQLGDIPFTGSPNWTMTIAHLAVVLLCAGAGLLLIARSAPRLWRRSA